MRKNCGFGAWEKLPCDAIIESRKEVLTMMQYNPYQPYKQNSFDWIYVADVEQIDSVSVAPSSKAWIMVQNEPIFALRAADNMGLVKTDLYRFEKIENKPKSSYVTSDDLAAAISKLREELRNESIVQSERTERAKIHI